jgi:hypothetical protein
MRVKYADGREEVVNAIMEAGTEIVEFSPKDEFQKTMEVAERNFAAMQEDQ